jgi:hypothetical protein
MPTKNVHRISASRKQVELAKAKATVAGLSALIHAPTLDGFDPAPDKPLISSRYKIEEGTTHYFGR